MKEYSLSQLFCFHNPEFKSLRNKNGANIKLAPKPWKPEK